MLLWFCMIVLLDRGVDLYDFIVMMMMCIVCGCW